MLTAYRNTAEQYRKIIDFLKKESICNKHQMWDAGRMNFWRSSVHGKKANDDPFFPDNVCTWVEGDEVVGLAISEYGREDIFIEVSEGHEALYKEIFDWIMNVWSQGKPSVKIIAFEDNAALIDVLTNREFGFSRHFENKRTFDLTSSDFSYKLPAGYRMTAFYECPDYASRVEVVRSAFDNTGYAKANLEKIHQSQDYIRDLDLGVISPDGSYAAYCIGWRWPGKAGVGYIEPVGTHADHRRKGLAAAVVKEAFSRLYAIGVNTVIISSYAEPVVANFLYDSLGPVHKRRVLEYEYRLPEKSEQNANYMV